MKDYNLECGEQKNKVKEFGRQLAVHKFPSVMINSTLYEEGAEGKRKRFSWYLEGEGEPSMELQR